MFSLTWIVFIDLFIVWLSKLKKACDGNDFNLLDFCVVVVFVFFMYIIGEKKDTRHASAVKDLHVEDFVLLFDVEDSAEATEVEVVELSPLFYVYKE